ncbi:MAG: response regulator [Planctomycetota bacterium]
MEQKTILIVDDDSVTLKMLDNHLTQAGYRVIRAEDGQTAVRLARRKQPDLIILDIMMPGMDGGDVAQTLRDHPGTADIPVVYLSSLVTETVEKTADQVLLGKPCNKAALLQVAREETM